jgi:hypothetical protein
MGGETLYLETPYLRAFPDPNTVFASRRKMHSSLLLPVATLSLSHLSPDWGGHIHFILPIEPWGGYGLPGDGTERYHNHLCRPNWIGYQLRGSKCELACDPRFFHREYYAEHRSSTDLGRAEAAELSAHYERVIGDFTRRRDFFREHGWLCAEPERWTGSARDKGRLRGSLVQDLGGVSWHGNWSNGSDEFPMSRYAGVLEGHDCDRVLPRTEDGRDFHYIGSVEMWNYIGDTNGVLMLFFDPKDRVALTTIDWS